MINNRVRRALSTGSALACVGFWLVGCGCGEEGISKSELDRAAHSKPPTAEQMAKVGQVAAQGFQQAKEHEKQWAKEHPEEAKKINAERARTGRPPLGQ